MKKYELVKVNQILTTKDSVKEIIDYLDVMCRLIPFSKDSMNDLLCELIREHDFETVEKICSRAKYELLDDTFAFWIYGVRNKTIVPVYKAFNDGQLLDAVNHFLKLEGLVMRVRKVKV